MPGATLTSGVYFLTRDVFFVNLTMNMPSDNVGIATQGFRIFCNGTLTTSLGHGLIANPGSNANGTNPGGNGTTNVLGAGVAGSQAAQAGSSVINSLGGNGGAGGGTAPGAGGVATPPAAGISTPRSIEEALTGFNFMAGLPTANPTGEIVDTKFTNNAATTALPAGTPASLLTGGLPLQITVNAGDKLAVWGKADMGPNGTGAASSIDLFIAIDNVTEGPSQSFTSLPAGDGPFGSSSMFLTAALTAGVHAVDLRALSNQASQSVSGAQLMVQRIAPLSASAPILETIQGGAGGGGGNSSIVAPIGAGGGGGGGVMVIAAHTITGNGTIEADGGVGGNDATAPGGGGGGGGVIYLVFNTSTYTGSIHANGGAGGTGSGGANGAAGSPGTVVQIQAPG